MPLLPGKTCLSLIRSGSQQKIPQACIAQGDRFAYASTLAVFILNAKTGLLERVLSGPQKPYTACAWNPYDDNQIVAASCDQDITLWDLERETKLASTAVPAGSIPSRLRWSLVDRNIVLLCVQSNMYQWDVRNADRGPLQHLKDFESKILSYSINSTLKSLMVVGTENGQMFIFDYQIGKATKWLKYEEPVICVEFDPLSDSYLLVALRSGVIALLDVNQPKESCVLSTFAKQPTGLRGLAFVPPVPGGFVTFSDRAAVLRLWNVSQPQPTALLKVARQSAMHSVAFLPQSTVAVCTLLDGTVALYDVQAQRNLWVSEGGHTETIFDCQFCPTRPLVLATASYDATVRLWHVDQPDSSISLTGASGPLYSVCWSPDGSRLAAGGLHGDVFMYDLTRASAVATVRHQTRAVYRVDWCAWDPDLLAAASGDGTCVLFRGEGTLVATLHHPAACFGCSFSPAVSSRQLAVACADSVVYLYSLENPAAYELSGKLAGHLLKAFTARWSPLVPNLIATTSDDTTCRVWDAASGGCTAVLAGHTSNVRGALFHSELPHVVITGSWDATIRIWNIETAECLKVLEDHHADVYGLAMHPSRPFALASSSRDTTLRFWSLNVLAPSLPLRASLGLPFTKGRAEAGEPAPGCGCLAGKASARLAESLRAAGSDVERGALIGAFFGAGAGTARLWELAAVIEAGGTMARTPGPVAGNGGAHPPTNGNGAGSHPAAGPASAAAWPPAALAPLSMGHDRSRSELLHVSEVEPVLSARAARLEAARTGRATGSGLKKEEALLAAAALWLQLGNLESYCEIMRELGQWDKALAVAPAVGLEYWQELVQARAEELREGGAAPEALAPLLVAGQQAPRLQEALLADGQLEECFAVAAASAAGGFEHLVPQLPHRHRGQGPARQQAAAGPSPQDLKCLHEVRLRQAEQRLAAGEPIWAAAALLTVNDAEGAVEFLLRGFEPDLAFLLSRALLKGPAAALAAGRAAADRAAALDDPPLARAALALLPEPERRERGEVLALRAASHLDVDGGRQRCLEKWGLPGPERLAAQAAQAEASGRAGAAAVALALSQDYERAFRAGLSFLRRKAASLLGRPLAPPDPEWESVAEARRVVEALAACPPGGAQGLYSPQRRELVAYAAYFGARAATRDGHLAVVGALYRQSARGAQGADAGCPLRAAAEALRFEELAATWSLNPEASRAGIEQLVAHPDCPLDVRSAARRLLAAAAAGGAAAPTDRSVLPMGVAIPSGAIRVVSPPTVISGARISSTPYAVDDSGACMTLGETLMWARATPFAPTDSGLPLVIMPV